MKEYKSRGSQNKHLEKLMWIIPKFRIDSGLTTFPTSSYRSEVCFVAPFLENVTKKTLCLTQEANALFYKIVFFANRTDSLRVSIASTCSNEIKEKMVRSFLLGLMMQIGCVSTFNLFQCLVCISVQFLKWYTCDKPSNLYPFACETLLFWFEFPFFI